MRWGSVLLVSLLVLLGAFAFHGTLEQFRALGLLGIFLANLLASLTFFLPAPGIATVVAGGSLYPPLLVGFLASFGAALGDCMGYIIGHSGKKVILKNHGKQYGAIIKLFKTYGGVVIFVCALVPNPLFDGVGIIAGVLEYPFYTYFLFLFLGRLARNILLAYLGFTLNSL